MRRIVLIVSLIALFPGVVVRPALAGDPLRVVFGSNLGDPFSGVWPKQAKLQTGRLNRNGVASACGAPKTCDIFTVLSGRAVDVYAFKNASGSSACVTATMVPLESCDLQMNGYLGGYDPRAICSEYLADPGFSSGTPPSSRSFTATVPAGENFFLPVHAIDPGVSDCDYVVEMECDGCAVAHQTIFASNNGFAGNTFDITPKVPIWISRFDVNLSAPASNVAAGTDTVEIYRRTGTSVGHETSADGWVSMGTYFVVPAGTDVGTAVLLDTLLLEPGQTYGFYVDLSSYDGSTTLRYTNSLPAEYANEHLSLVTGNGQGSPAFGQTFEDRAWNGRIHYFVSPYVFADGFESGTPCLWNTTPNVCL